MIENLVQPILVGAAIACGTLILNKVRRLPQIDKFKALSHILAPAAVVAATMYSGGWVAIGFDRPAFISELRTETQTAGGISAKPGFVFIADPDGGNSDYLVEMAHPPAKVWSSLNEEQAGDNVNKGMALIPTGLEIKYPLTKVHEPLAVVIEGELGSNLDVDSRSESVDEWKVSARRRLALIIPVLFNCFVALGIGLVTGAPPIDLKQNNTRKKRAKPNKKRIIKRNTVNR